MVLPFSIRRRERQAGRRMALRLAVLLALVIGGTFIYWRMQVNAALEAASAESTVGEACGDLDETNELVVNDDPSAQGVDEAALAERLADCEEQGFEPMSPPAE